MAAVAASSKAFAAAPRVARRAVARPAARRPVVVRASAERKVAAVSAGVMVAAGAALTHPLVAQATELTPSLKNFLGSLVAGGFVLVALAGAVTLVSNFDPVNRG